MSNKVQEPKNTRVFVSYLNDIPSKSIAGLLAEILEGRFGFSVFFDVNKLRPTGGVKWDDKLFDEARNTDVLIVLLQPEIGVLSDLFSGWIPALKNPGLLRDPDTALLAVALSSIWASLGFTFIVITAGLQSVPKELYESA